MELHLITKHGGNIFDSLKKAKINTEIFSSISHIMPKQEKHTLINANKKAIFIDDSFAERKKISERYGIPCFDLDAVECLLDDRR
jgi:hypothetical protein